MLSEERKERRKGGGLHLVKLLVSCYEWECDGRYLYIIVTLRQANESQAGLAGKIIVERAVGNKDRKI